MTRLQRFLLVSSLAAAGFAGVPPAAHAQDAADLILRLDRLEAENRRLTGQIEELRFQLRKTDDQLKRFQADADTRFRDIEGAGRPVARPGTPAATPQRRSDAFDPAAGGNVPGAPRPLGAPGTGSPALPQAGVGGAATGTPIQVGPGLGTSPPGSVTAGALPPGGRLVQDGDPGTPLDVTAPRRPPTPAIPGQGDPKSDYDYARALIDRGDYELAEGAFRDYLQNYPRERRVADATFWLGESYLRRTRYREAAEQFLAVTSKYSASVRAPEAMLKLGIALRGLGAVQEACGTFDQVGRKYPNAAAPIRQAVEREKGRAQC